MSLLLCLLLATGIEGTWRSHTNTDYINDVCGDDSTLGLATTGGVVVLDVAQGSIQRLRAVTNSDSLPVNRCVCIAPDPDGNFWVGTDGGGLAVVPAESGRAVSFRPSDLAMRIRTLLWDGDRLLVGTEEGLYDVRTRGTFLDFGDDSIGHYTTAYTPELLSDRVLSLFAHEGYWIGTNRGVTRVDRQLREWTPYRRPLGDSVRAMALLDANLLVGTEHGVAVLDSGAFRPLVQFPGPVELNDMAVRGSDVYVGTPDGLFKVDTLDSAGLVLVHETDVRSILLAQTIWLGCGGSEAFGSGLHYLRSGQGWQWYGGGSLTIYDVNDCVSTPAGDVYCCHYSTLVSRLTPDGIRTINDPLPNAVMARPDSRGRVWFAHFAWDGGLSVYDPQTGVWERTQWGAGSDWNIIQAFGLDRADTKWMFNKAGSVVAVDSTGRQAVFNIPELVSPPGGNYEFTFDARGRVWLGMTVGLELIDFGGTLHDPADDHHQLYTAGLPSTDVRSVAVDGGGRIWGATPAGAFVWDGNAARVYTTENTRRGLLSNNLTRVRVDAADRVWLLSEQGLSVLDLVSGKWQSFSAQNSRLIGNTQGVAGFYTGLSVNDALGEVVVATRRGLSVFRLAPRPDSGFVEFPVFPNPCVIGIHDRVAIGNLPRDSRVTVYSLSGQPVAELEPDPGLGRAVWHPGRCASGVYLFVVATPGGTRTGRIALVRP